MLKREKRRINQVEQFVTNTIKNAELCRRAGVLTDAEMESLRADLRAISDAVKMREARPHFEPDHGCNMRSRGTV
jgi:hypothetical protein